MFFYTNVGSGHCFGFKILNFYFLGFLIVVLDCIDS